MNVNYYCCCFGSGGAAAIAFQAACSGIQVTDNTHKSESGHCFLLESIFSGAIIATERSCCLRSLVEIVGLGCIAGWAVEKKICSVRVLSAAFLGSRSRWDRLDNGLSVVCGLR